MQIDQHAVFGQVTRHDPGHSAGQPLARLHRQNAPPVVLQHKAHFGPRHRQAAHDIETGGIFAARGSQEFAPRGDFAKQVFSFDPGAGGQGGGAFVHQRAMIDHPAPALT